ncbi:hypothetical protein D3C86_1260870 [compost metagenome]
MLCLLDVFTNARELETIARVEQNELLRQRCFSDAWFACDDNGSELVQSLHGRFEIEGMDEDF